MINGGIKCERVCVYMCGMLRGGGGGSGGEASEFFSSEQRVASFAVYPHPLNATREP